MEGSAVQIRHFSGKLITPGNPDYHEARSVWNGVIDRKPAAIARCHTPADVAVALRHARNQGLKISVRGGGHNVAGTAVCDDGMVIDLSHLKAIDVDVREMTASAQPGVLWGELDEQTQQHGLATTGGVVSHTGIAGLTLGGGIGWLMRRYGLTVDNLLSTEVVLADGEAVTASTGEHPELFWALRGGGGRFGIVTRFNYRLHRVGPEVLAGPVLWPMEQAPQLLRHYRDWTDAAPPDVATIVHLRKAPPLAPVPTELHGRRVCIVAMLYTGPIRNGPDALAPLRNFGSPLVDLVAPRPYLKLQSMLDPTVPHGWHYYWKSAELDRLEDASIDAIVEHAATVSERSYAVMFHLGGAIQHTAEEATAYSHRDARHNLNINGVWTADQNNADREIAWTREFHAAVPPWESGVYTNFLDHDEGSDRLVQAFGHRALERLAAVKRDYDPAGVFGQLPPS
ncbi:MAG TPA: FAD-binding oxidoreductase [Nitriliruptorales bacterium]|nr:FAD-binding oxidoreductase [Nitriliruptorales bacterium]